MPQIEPSNAHKAQSNTPTLVLARQAQDNEIAARIELLRAAVESLRRDGHHILSAGLGETPRRPWVRLEPTLRLAALAEQGQGAYHLRGINAQGQHYRQGILLTYRTVLVLWQETGN